MGAVRAAALGAFILTSFNMPAMAQVPGLTPDQLQQLQQRGVSPTTALPAVTPRETILEPTAPSAQLPTSELEQILSTRAGMKLQQYGYDQLGVGRAVSLPQAGAVQSNYVLGVGDEVVLTLRGQENNEYRTQVDRDGNVTFPRLNPVSAAGRSFEQFRQDLINAIHRAYTSTDGFVTIGRMRQISVFVSGEVGSPGIRTLTGLSTLMDAIFVSGGIKKSGSLRNVQILRGGRIMVVDLYSALIGRVQSRVVTLADGDKIVIPTIGGTVAIAGQARRPGIYELPAGRSSISVREAVSLASGMAVPGSYTVSLLRTLPDGKRQLVDVSNSSGNLLRDGEIVLVKQAVNISVDQVKLVGAVRSPGTVALGRFKTLHDLITSPETLRPDAYMLIGVIDRTDPATLNRTVLPFSPLRVVQGREDLALASDDIVRILTKEQMLRLLKLTSVKPTHFADELAEKTPGGRLNAPNLADTTRHADDEAVLGVSTPQAVLRGAAPGVGSADISNVPGVQSGRDTAGGRTVIPSAVTSSSNDAVALRAELASEAANTDITNLSKADNLFYGNVLGDYWVSVTGGVRNPGTYLVSPGTQLSDMLAAIGGLVDDVDMDQFEITSTVFDNPAGSSTSTRTSHPATPEEFRRVVVRSFDRIEFRRIYSDKFSGYVKIEGEVRNPGVYSVLHNEALSSVLRRAGGLTDAAYPDGTVLLRNSVAKAEQAETQRIVSDMRSQLLTFMMKPAQSNTQPPSPDALRVIDGLISELENAKPLGRVPVIADMSKLVSHPERDTMLEPGDSISIPKRPTTVLIVGEVLRSGAQRYNKSFSVDDYVDSVGGITSQADSSRIIIVLPDGSIRRDGSTWLNFGFGASIPPGSTIYVPRDLEVYSTRQVFVDAIQIFSQLATSAAALAVLSKQ